MDLSRKPIYFILILVLLLSFCYFPVVVGGEDKHRVITEEEFQDKLKNKDYDFSWCVFPFEVNLSGKTLTDADFSNAIFEKDVNCSKTTFKSSEDYTRFIGTTFKGDAHFEDVIFKDKVAFNGSIFERSAYFQRSIEEDTFQDGASFSYIKFGKEENESIEANFTNVIFDDYANFEYAVFNGKTIFEKANFLDGAIRFVQAEFYGETNFKDAEFNEKGGYLNFEDANFEGKVYFNSAKFKGNASFYGSVFKEETYFTEINCTGEKIGFQKATFKDSTMFNRVEFRSEVEFDGATFEEHVNFVETVFSNNAHFRHETTFDSVNFRKATFEKDANASFLNAVFEDDADFRGITFGGKAIFDGATFKGEVKFQNETLFENHACFGDVTFEKSVDFSGATFKGYTSFKGETVFYDSVNFTNVDFDTNATFYETIFEGRAEFRDTDFKEETKFDRVTFKKGVNFKGDAKFGEDTNGTVEFTNCVFEDTTLFESVKFFGDAEFNGSSFYGKTSFKGCTFNSEADFSYSQFIGDIDFIETNSFNGKLSFLSAEFSRLFNLNPQKNNQIDLRFLRCFGNGKIIADLDQTYFQSIYFIENIDFEGSDWPENYKIYEESNKKDLNLNYSNLERIYRDLKDSFKANGNEGYAGIFYYREMEMRRLGAKEEENRKQEYWLLFLKKLCGYGEKPENVIFCSLGVIGLFALLFWILGIEVNNLPWRFEFFNFREDIREVENRQTTLHNIRELGFNRYWILNYLWRRLSNFGVTDFAYCLLFSIASFTTLGSKYIKPKGNASRWLSALESLVGAFFIALFIYVFVRKMLR